MVKRAYTNEERLERACRRVAMHIRGLWEEKGSSDTRLLESPLLPDELVVAGQSRAYRGTGRREHVVPRLVVVRECLRMLEAGHDDEALAAFIRHHVKIVLLTAEESARLDRKEHLGLRQAMPPGWTFGDDIFARLDAAGIEWIPLPRLDQAARRTTENVVCGSDTLESCRGAKDIARGKALGWAGAT